MEQQDQNISKRAYDTFASRKLQDNAFIAVDEVKGAAAVLWDHIDNISVPPGNSEAGRLVALAKTSLEEAVMWAVKAYSRQ